MARDYYTLGPVPANVEDCAQVGSEGYTQRARKECRVWRDLITRVCKPLLTLGIKSFPHDAGTYHEVVVWFDPDSETEVAEMCRIEDEMPDEWDHTARMQLEELSTT